VIIPGKTSPDFWHFYRALPKEVQALARKNYRLWSQNALHPSLHFKPIQKPNWSAHVGDRYRVVGKFSGRVLVGQWIGPHEEYNKKF
jgi:hypothetical protein